MVGWQITHERNEHSLSSRSRVLDQLNAMLHAKPAVFGLRIPTKADNMRVILRQCQLIREQSDYPLNIKSKCVGSMIYASRKAANVRIGSK